MIEAAQTGPMRGAAGFYGAHHRQQNEVCVCGNGNLTTKPRIASPAALLQCCSVGIHTLTALLASHFFWHLFPRPFVVLATATGTFALPPRRN